MSNTLNPEILFDRTDMPELVKALGPQGLGAHAILGAVDDEWLASFQQQIQVVDWRDNHRVDTNKRGLVIDQRHNVVAYKLRVGDQDKVPEFMRESGEMVARFVRSLGFKFPLLGTWQADEVSMHQYDDPEVGLSRHRDNQRFWGVVAVLTVEGSSDFVIYDGDMEHVLHAEPGTLMLMRATNLTGDPADVAYQQSMNPEHGVVRVRSLPRVSFIVRDNLLSNEPIHGFTYDNWPDARL